jgi:hypothetical protein
MNEWTRGYITAVIFMTVLVILILVLAGKDTETIIRSNEQLRYENAQLQSANLRLLEELEEGLVNWEDVE